MQTILIIALTCLGIWTIYVSFQLKKTKDLFESLTRVKNAPLSEVLGELLKSSKASKKEFDEVYREIARIDKEKKYYIKRAAVVRFSPFGKEELEQSFSMALLDETETGVVITNIHAKEQTRIFAKVLTRGKSESALSIEEKKAIQLVLRK